MSGDVFNLLVTQNLNYSASVLTFIYLGMLASLPIQLFGPAIAKRTTFRTLMIGGSVVNLVSLLAIVLAIQSDITTTVRLVVLVIAAVAVEIAYSLSYGTVWGAWLGELVTSRDRPRIMATGKILTQGLMALCFLVQTIVFDGEVTSTFYMVVASALITFMIASITVFTTLPDVKQDTSTASPGPNNLSDFVSDTWQSIVLVSKRKKYRLVLLSSAGQLLIGVPLLSVYLSDVAGAPAQAVSISLVLRTVASIAVMFVLPHLIGRLGSSKVILYSGTFATIVMMSFVLSPTESVSPDSVWRWAPVLFVPMLFGAKSIFATTTSNAYYDIVEPKDRVTVFTFSDICSSSFLQLTAIIGAWAVAASTQNNRLLEIGPFAGTWVSIWVIIGIFVSIILTYRLFLTSREDDDGVK